MSIMWVDVDVINTLGVKIRGPTDQPMDLVAFVEKKLCEVRSILAGYTRD